MTPARRPTSEQAKAWLADLHTRALAWVRQVPAPSATALTESYVDLFFAFGMARRLRLQFRRPPQNRVDLFFG